MSEVSKRELNRARLRAEILSAAKRIIVRNHNAEFTMPELASEAGVALATPYKHFKSKAGVLIGLMELEHAQQDVANRFKSKHANDGLEQLLEVAQTRVLIYTSNSVLYRAVVSAVLRLDPAAAGDASDAEAILKLWEAGVIVAANNDQIDRSLNTVLVALTVRSTFLNLLNTWAVGAMDDAEFFNEVSFRISLVVSGLATDPADKRKWRTKLLRFQDLIIRASLVGP